MFHKCKIIIEFSFKPFFSLSVSKLFFLGNPIFGIRCKTARQGVGPDQHEIYEIIFLGNLIFCKFHIRCKTARQGVGWEFGNNNVDET